MDDSALMAMLDSVADGAEQIQAFAGRERGLAGKGRQGPGALEELHGDVGHGRGVSAMRAGLVDVGDAGVT